MAFFDKLTKSVTEASQKTVTKTKELADTAKLNASISGEEKKLNNLYLQIGKLYVDLHREDYEEDFSGLMLDIEDTESKIVFYRQQIRDIKGVQTCASCGADVAPGSAFCTSCGAEMPKIEKPVPAGFVRCSVCGTDIQEGMRFCTSCGNPLQAAPVEEPAAEPEAAVPAANTCPNCGASVDDGMAFCTQCGTAL